LKTLILGAGATGGYFGSRLIENGADVTFLARPGRSRQLRQSGLSVTSQFGDLHLSDLKVIEQVHQPFDLIILSCKAYDLDSAIDTIRPAMAANSTVLPLLNGMRHIDELKRQFKPECIIGGLCIISSTLADDGKIMHLNDSHTLKFGELSGDLTPRIAAIQDMMQGSKIAWRASEFIQQDMWEKWAMLVPLAGITCLMRGSIGQIARSPGGAETAVQLFEECLAVFRASGFEPREDYVKSVRARSIDPKSTLMASMLRDIERGGKVESDHVLGDFIARADAKNIAVPILKLAYCHVKTYETRKQEELAKAMATA
jgi:2-dehydropantoate 2-reductase